MKILKLAFITTQQITETFIEIYRNKLHNKLTFILQGHLYYSYRQITQKIYIYRDIYINTTNVNYLAHRKFLNVTLWFCATQQITKTTNYANFPYTNYRDHKNFYYKKTTQRIPANRKFPIHSSIKMLYPTKIAKISHSAKSKITYTAKKKAIQMLLQYKCFFNFAQNNIGTTPFFTTK